MNATDIDLKELTRGEVRNLSGHERGAIARQHFRLDAIDQVQGQVRVFVPDDVYTVSSSFFQGMFAESVRAAGGRERFLSRYHFVADNVIMRQIENGIEASLMSRRPLAS